MSKSLKIKNFGGKEDLGRSLLDEEPITFDIEGFREVEVYLDTVTRSRKGQGFFLVEGRSEIRGEEHTFKAECSVITRKGTATLRHPKKGFLEV